MGRQLELFPPGTLIGDIVIEQDWRWRCGDWRWVCTRCRGGGAHYSSRSWVEPLAKWAEKHHHCRPDSPEKRGKR